MQDNRNLTAKGEEYMGKHTIDPQISAEHLAGAVRFATVSNADNSLTDYTKFDAFHEYLKETYPLVHKHLTLEHTDQAGLLYHWKGTGKSGAAPLLLMDIRTLSRKVTLKSGHIRHTPESSRMERSGDAAPATARATSSDSWRLLRHFLKRVTNRTMICISPMDIWRR